MTEHEILDYYNENWNDYNLIVDMLHKIIDNHEDEIQKLKSMTASSNNDDLLKEKIDALKHQLLICQDSLDEETHKL